MRKNYGNINGLELKAAADTNRAVVIEASAGMGKTQLAAEYVWRYGFVIMKVKHCLD